MFLNIFTKKKEEKRMLCCQRITGRGKGCYIWGYIWRNNPHGERWRRRKNDFAGMVGRMAAGMVGVVRVCWCGGAGVPG